jgi:hypothetical protein
MERDINFLIEKEKRLLTAKLKVEKRLEFFKRYSNLCLHRPFKKLSEHQIKTVRLVIDGFKWNEHHDLNDRLQERLWSNWAEAKDLEFETNGFVAYNIK